MSPFSLSISTQGANHSSLHSIEQLDVRARDRSGDARGLIERKASRARKVGSHDDREVVIGSVGLCHRDEGVMRFVGAWSVPLASRLSLPRFESVERATRSGARGLRLPAVPSPAGRGGEQDGAILRCIV